MICGCCGEPGHNRRTCVIIKKMRCERVRQARATGLMEWPNTNKLVLTPQMRSMDWPTLKEKLLKQKIKKKVKKVKIIFIVD